MDKSIIEEAIKDLEYSETTIKNVEELANLYIVLDHLKVADSVVPEFPILSIYEDYCDSKCKFQRKQIPEDAIISGIDNICTELGSFIRQLYCSSDTNKERKRILKLIQMLYDTYVMDGK